MIDVLLEPSPNPGELLPLVTVHIPDQDVGTVLPTIDYVRHLALTTREDRVGIPTTYYDSDNPTANPLSERELYYEDIAERLFSDRGGVIAHTLSDTYRDLDASAPDGVQVLCNQRRLGTVCLQGILSGIQTKFEDKYPPVVGVGLARLPVIGKALGALFNVAGREAARQSKIEDEKAKFLATIMTIRVVTPEDAARIRDIRAQEEKRLAEELANLAQARREAAWPELRAQFAAERLRPDRVAALRRMVAAKRANRSND